MDEKLLIDAIELHKSQLPATLYYIRKSDYLVNFKEKKIFYKSASHKTQKYLFRRFLYKSFI